MKCLIAYDISEPRRLRRVAKVLERYGIRIEKSVFTCDLETAKIMKLRQELYECSKREDTIMLFQLPSNIKCVPIRGMLETQTAQEIYI